MNSVRLGIPIAASVCLLFGPTVLRAQDLDPRIAAPRVETYRAIRDAREWQNPYLVVHAASIEVVASGIPNGRITVPVDELRAVLVRLPVSAWPYGRVVGLQNASIISGITDLDPIARNRRAAEEVLEALDITASWWPA